MTSQPGELWLAADAWCLALNSAYAKVGRNSRCLKCEQFCHYLTSAENISHQEDVDGIYNTFGLDLFCLPSALGMHLLL
jgi:hypothetical protein